MFIYKGFQKSSYKTENCEFKVDAYIPVKWSESSSVVSDCLRPHIVHGVLQARILERGDGI